MTYDRNGNPPVQVWLLVEEFHPLAQLYRWNKSPLAQVCCWNKSLTCSHYPCVKTHEYARWYEKSTRPMQVLRKTSILMQKLYAMLPHPGSAGFELRYLYCCGLGGCISPFSDNRGAGSSIGHQIKGLPDGTKVRIQTKNNDQK